MSILPGKTIICFDLGGVLARICTHWQEAARWAGVELGTELDSMMSDCPVFDPYQHGQISQTEYLEGLANYLVLDRYEDALKVHLAILIEPYSGTYELVSSLHDQGFATGCLSNTNEPHWQVMAFGTKFPAICQLGVKVASHEVQLHKPDPPVFAKFEEMSGFSGSEVVFFEDSPANVAVALSQGWQAIPIDPKGDAAAQIWEGLRGKGMSDSGDYGTESA